MKLLIVTTDKETVYWNSLPDKLKKVKNALDSMEGNVEPWEVEVLYKDVVPEVKSGRVTHDWFNGISYPLFRQGNHLVALHMSENQKKKWKIKPTLRGSNQRDTDFVGEMYFWADENTRRGMLSQFVQTLLHECSHEIANSTGVPDNTHEYHNQKPDISRIFPSYNMAHWQPEYQAGMKKVSFLQKLLQQLLGAQKKPVFFWQDYPVSQEYGVRNAAWYPKTKHHIGTDYATPEGTPIIAPKDCEVVRSELSSVLGNWCEVKMGDNYYCFMHLRTRALLGQRKEGWVIGFTGNTGFTTAPHCHIEGWTVPRNLKIINESNYKKYTFNVN